MKRVLLIALGIAFSVSLFAQEKMKMEALEVRSFEENTNIVYSLKPIPELNSDKAINEDISRIVIGKSGNQRSFRREETHVIYYNPQLDVISITFVLDPATYPEASSMGVIGQFYSTDKGQTWQGPIVLSDNSNLGIQNYYPSGIIYNPAGNSNIDNAYGVAQGTASTDWNSKVFGSARIGGGSYTNYVWTSTDPEYPLDGYWNQFGLQQINNSVRAMNMKAKGEWAEFTDLGFEIINGQLNGTSFDWTFNQSLDFDLDMDMDNVIQWNGRFMGNDAGAEICWSKNGMIGYAWVIGRADDINSGLQPVLYKTIDAGNTWTRIAVDFYSTEMQNIWSSSLIASHNGMFIPFFKESTGVVDINGDLQMFAAVGSHSADVFNYADSLFYQWTYPGHLYNITFNNNGIQNLQLIEEFNTKNVKDDDEGSYAGTGWQHRLFASKTENEKQVFITWTDTQDDTQELNVQPDIFGWSKSCLENGGQMAEPVCFTAYTLYEGFYYFTYAAENAYMNSQGKYVIPYMQAITPGEFASNGSPSSDPVSANYITGIEFDPLSGDDVCLINIEPEQQSVNESEVFNTSVFIHGVENLGSFELDLTFDSDVLQANAVSIGSFLGSSGRQVFPLTNNIDNGAGLIQFAVTTLGPNPPGPNGDGVLIDIEWQSLTVNSELSTDLILENIQMTQPNGTIIPFTSQNASVHVSHCFEYDFDCDCDVDIIDITMIAYTYGTLINDPNYNPVYDLDDDGDIDIVDISLVTYNYGWSCGSKNNGIDLSDWPLDHAVLSFVDVSIDDQTHQLELMVEEVSQLGAYELKLQYDAEKIEVISMEGGEFLKNTKRTYLPLQSEIDVEKGLISFAAGSLGHIDNGAEGNGSLMKIQYKILDEGGQPFEMIDAQLARIDAQAIPYKMKAIKEDLSSGINSCYPNPFSDELTFEYTLSETSQVSFKVYSITGELKLIKTISNQNPGYNAEIIIAEDLLPGVYMVSFEVNDHRIDTKRVILLEK